MTQPYDVKYLSRKKGKQMNEQELREKIAKEIESQMMSKKSLYELPIAPYLTTYEALERVTFNNSYNIALNKAAAIARGN